MRPHLTDACGKVLAVGAPLDLVKERGNSSLEDTFVGYLADAAGIDRSKKVEAPPPQSAPIEAEPMRVPKRFNLVRLWAYPGARPWSFCAIRSGWRLPSSAQFF